MTHRGLIATRVQKVNLFTLTYGNRARKEIKKEKKHEEKGVQPSFGEHSFTQRPSQIAIYPLEKIRCVSQPD